MNKKNDIKDRIAMLIRKHKRTITRRTNVYEELKENKADLSEAGL